MMEQCRKCGTEMTIMEDRKNGYHYDCRPMMTDNERIRASVGDFVEIIANTNEHEFEIGQVVTVVEWEEFGDYDDTDYGVECAPINGGNHWFVRHTDYRITAHPSEYERLREQNTLMLSALEEARSYIRGYAWGSTEAYEVVQAIDNAITQVMGGE